MDTIFDYDDDDNDDDDDDIHSKANIMAHAQR